MNLSRLHDERKLTLKNSVSDQELLFGFLANVNSKNTARARRLDLKIFFRFMKEYLNGKRIERITRTDILLFRNFLLGSEDDYTQKKYSRSSINRIIATLSSFFDHCIDCKIVETSPVVKINRFKIEKKVKSTYLKEESVLAMLNSVDRTSGAGKLHFAILTTLFTTGMRQGELRDLKIKNLTYLEDRPAFRYTSKGGTEIVTPLNKKAEEAIGEYILYRQDRQEELRADTPLFCTTRSKGRISGPTINTIFKRYAAKAGIKEKVSAHCARVSVISSLKSRGVGIDDIANYVGHKDIRTTESYIKWSRDKASLADMLKD